MGSCSRCGFGAGDGRGSCSRCGHPTADPHDLAIAWRSEQVLAGRAAEVWLVLGLLAYGALVYLYYALSTVANSLGALEYDTAYGVSQFAWGLSSLLVAAAMAGVVVLVNRGHPLGRVLAGVAGGVMAADAVFWMSRGGGFDVLTVVLVLAAAGWSAGLLLPAVSEWFAEHPDPGAPPARVTAARWTGWLLGVLLAVEALAPVIGAYESRFIVFAALRCLLAVGLLAGATWLTGAMDRPPPAARILLTALGIITPVVVLVENTFVGQAVLEIGLGVTLVALLWAWAPIRAVFPAR